MLIRVDVPRRRAGTLRDRDDTTDMTPRDVRADIEVAACVIEHPPLWSDGKDRSRLGRLWLGTTRHLPHEDRGGRGEDRGDRGAVPPAPRRTAVDLDGDRLIGRGDARDHTVGEV